MSAMEKLEATIGHPFEHEWDIDHDIHDLDQIDPTIPFLIIDEGGNVVKELTFNYGISVINFHHNNQTKLILSIYETDMFEEGKYVYEYRPKTLNGKKVGNISGQIIFSTEKSDSIPKIQRQVRPWDLLRSKSPGGAGERASDEKQKERLSICEQCPRFVKVTSQCLECGCMMKLKTKLAAATCPLGKW